MAKTERKILYSNLFGYVASLTAGAIAAAVTSMLIYFNQHPGLHHAVALMVAGVVFMAGYLFVKNIPKPSATVTAWTVAVLFTLAWLMPQFLYQIRPWTYYLAGFAMAGVLLAALAADISGGKFPWSSGLFLLGYAAGAIAGPAMLQYPLMGLTAILTVSYLPSCALKKRQKIIVFSWMVAVAVIYGQFREPIKLFAEQPRYEDKVVFVADTQYGELVVTQWKNDHWFFMDGLKILSSIDEFMFYEPMAHAAFQVVPDIRNVLVVGAENGCLMREVLKHDGVEQVDVLSYDTLLRNIAGSHPLFMEMNHRVYAHEKLTIIHKDIIGYLSGSDKKYDAIFIDLPDPRSVETNQFYTHEFYTLLRPLFREEGVMITQAGSPYFATKAFYSIGHTIGSAGYHALPLHNQILTIGEWGWFISSKSLLPHEIRAKLLESNAPAVSTRWYNGEAASLIASFGKTWTDTLHLEVNAISRPVVYKYYLQGSWDLR